MTRPTHEGAARVVQGLFSGVRGTSIINTILNRAYMQVANDEIADEDGVIGIDVKRVHRGDDIWVTNVNDLWAASLYDRMVSSGLILQPSKQMFGRHGEFLRLLYFPDDAQGYLCRAIAGLNLGLLQSSGANDIGAVINTIADGCATMYRRGADGRSVYLLLKRLVWYHFVYYSRTGQVTHACSAGVWAPRACNGLEVGIPGYMATIVHGLPKLPVCDDVVARVPDGIASRMSSDQVSKLFSRLELTEVEADRIKKMLHNMNNKNASRNNDIGDITYRLQKDYAEWNAKMIRHAQAHKRCCLRTTRPNILNHRDLNEYYAKKVPRSGRLDCLIRKYLPYECEDVCHVQDTSLCIIRRAMSTSPYRNVNIMSSLYTGNEWQLLRALVNTSRINSVRDAACVKMGVLDQTFGKSRALKIVNGDVVDLGSLKYLFTSAVASYVSNVIVECLLLDGREWKEMDDYAWLVRVRQITIEVVSYIAIHTRLLRVLHS